MENLICFVALCVILYITDSTQAPTKTANDLSFFQSYYLKRAPNRVAVCGHGKCRGCLWEPQWVITTMDCVKESPVVVYHLHDEQFDCSNNTCMEDPAEKRMVDKILRHPKSQNRLNIAFLHLETPYDNLSHMNFVQNNVSVDYLLFETWITDVLENNIYDPEKEDAAAHVISAQDLAPRNFGSPVARKTPAFKVFATIILLPFFTFIVVYFVILFFSRTPAQCNNVVRGYYMFGKSNGYEETNI